MKIKDTPLLLFTAIVFSFCAKAQEKPGASAQEVADKLSNPVSGMRFYGPTAAYFDKSWKMGDVEEVK